MNFSHELEKLGELHRKGVLSDEEFSRAKARVLGTAPGGGGGSAPAVLALNSMRRSRSDRWLGGVCGGLAATTGLTSWVWRLLFVAAAMFAGGGVLLYVLLWVLLPDESPVNYRVGSGDASGQGSGQGPGTAPDSDRPHLNPS